jgi:hypothetical protein
MNLYQFEAFFCAHPLRKNKSSLTTKSVLCASADNQPQKEAVSQ